MGVAKEIQLILVSEGGGDVFDTSVSSSLLVKQPVVPWWLDIWKMTLCCK